MTNKTTTPNNINSGRGILSSRSIVSGVTRHAQRA